MEPQHPPALESSLGQPSVLLPRPFLRFGPLRRRFLAATGLLLGLQLVGTSSALLSWRHVAGTVEDEQTLADWREEVTGFGAIVREQYVHQAHAFIEGGPGHLDHYGQAELEARHRLDRLAGLPLPQAPERLASLGSLYSAFADDFRRDAVPALMEGSLDRAGAAALHSLSEQRANAVEREVATLVRQLDGEQEMQRASASLAVTRAWWATVSALLMGLLLVVFVTRNLAQAVLDPLDELRRATARFAAGDARVRVGATPSSGDEIAALAEAFNQMVERVTAAEDRRIRAERLAALGEMSAAVAHELLNPLTVILGTSQDATVLDEANHARRVVQGLLGFARPGEEQPSRVDLGRLAQELVERMGPAADAAGLHLRHSGAGWIESASQSAARQILDNLVQNAIDASPEGADVTIEVSSVAVLVLDCGAGVPARIRGRLYEPFVTARPTGTGLGLAIAARIARALGGEIHHADREGGGTIATWTLGSGDV